MYRIGLPRFDGTKVIEEMNFANFLTFLILTIYQRGLLTIVNKKSDPFLDRFDVL